MSSSIADLPCSTNPIQLDISQATAVSAEPRKEPDLDQNTISQIVSGLQQAGMSGATLLPSRDIPMNTEAVTRDEQTQPHYIPATSIRNFIPEYDPSYQNNYSDSPSASSGAFASDEVQTSILLAILYFLFQLPVVKRTFIQHMPFMCHGDGNYNLYGLVVVCALYGGVYYAWRWITNKM